MSALTLLLLAASPWVPSYEPVAVASYLDRQNAAVLVVTAGAPTDSSQAAEVALINALRSGGQTRLVMTGMSLAVLPIDRDDDLVKKATALPVDVIIVQRVFPGSNPSSPEVAVATLYDKAGTPLGAMAVTAGQPLQKREGARRQTAGQDAVVGVLKEKSRPENTNAPTDSAKITFGLGAMVNVQTGQIVSTWVNLYQQGKPLNGARFYEVVGRPELAKRYRGRMGARVALMAGGGAVTLGGGLMALLTLSPGCAVYDAASFRCVQTRTPSLVVPGLVIGSIGLVALMVGAFINPNPVGPQEAVELAQEFNRKLDATSEAPKKTKMQVSFAIAPTADGVSAAFAVRF